MIFLDTDHLSIVVNIHSVQHQAFVSRLKSANEFLAVPIVSVEEQCKGWLAKISRQHEVHHQIAAYERLKHLFQFFRKWEIAGLDETAADLFKQFRKQKIRIGSQDLKIAAIAVAHDALLLSANLRDFRQVPSLRVENWLE